MSGATDASAPLNFLAKVARLDGAVRGLLKTIYEDGAVRWVRIVDKSVTGVFARSINDLRDIAEIVEYCVGGDLVPAGDR